MKVVTIEKYGGPEVLAVRQISEPEPERGQVSITVAAAGVNFADILARKGLYPDAPKLPAVVGYEVAGEVRKAGPGAHYQKGDRVLALTQFGGYGEVVAVPEEQVFPLPGNLSYSEAAAIPVNYLTAWQLGVMGGLTGDDTLLIHNIGGGVGLAALTIARHKGATVIGTASASKHDRLREFGCHHLIDYRTEDWVRRVRELTDGRGVDLVYDPQGGSGWKKSFSVLSKTGRLGMFGVSQVTESRLPKALKFLPVLRHMPFYTPVQLMNSNKGVYGVNIGRLWGEKQKVKRWADAILDGVRDGWIAPHVDATFSFDQAAEAHRYIEERKNFGKVVLTF